MTADCVSIVTRTKDRPLLLVRAIESVLNQSFENWEHIIVNDGGNKETVEAAARRFGDRYRDRLKQIHHPKSLGIVPALNAGMTEATGTYVVVHDDDDSWEPAFLEKAVGYLKTRKVVIPGTCGVMCHAMEIAEKLTEDSVTELFRYSLNGWIDSISLAQLAVENFIPPISFLFERSVFSEIGLFTQLRFAEDWDFYLRFLCKYEIAVLPEHLANYHIRSNSTGSYSNTLAIGPYEHRALATALRNDFLRKDIEAGRFGLGFLIALSAQAPIQGNLKHRLWKFRRRTIARLKSKFF